MKLQVLLLSSTSLPLCISRLSTSHLSMPLISISTNFQASSITVSNPIFSHPKKLSSFTMAACIHSSRTETPQANDHHHVYNYVKYCRQSYPDLVSCVPFSEITTRTIKTGLPTPEKSDNNEDEHDDDDKDDLWLKMKDEARFDVQHEPILSNYYFDSILVHDSMESALANILSMKLSYDSLPSNTLYDVFHALLSENQEIIQAVTDDLKAVKERDPACFSYVHCFLNFKGFLACQAHRIGNKLWSNGRKVLALLIQNRVSEVFAVDIHPGAKIGRGILLDHATGLVIGETAVIGDNVSILHNVTLGGTGKVSGDRHPKIGDGVLIGAGTCVLGNVVIGDGAKIGAGSVVLKEVPCKTTAVGNPARLMGVKLDKIPSLTMDHTSHISEWSDYVI